MLITTGMDPHSNVYIYVPFPGLYKDWRFPFSPDQIDRPQTRIQHQSHHLSYCYCYSFKRTYLPTLAHLGWPNALNSGRANPGRIHVEL